MAKKFGKNGKIRMEKFFSDEKFANDSLEIYSKVITKAKTSHSINSKQIKADNLYSV